MKKDTITFSNLFDLYIKIDPVLQLYPVIKTGWLSDPLLAKYGMGICFDHHIANTISVETYDIGSIMKHQKLGGFLSGTIMTTDIRLDVSTPFIINGLVVRNSDNDIAEVQCSYNMSTDIMDVYIDDIHQFYKRWRELIKDLYAKYMTERND